MTAVRLVRLVAAALLVAIWASTTFMFWLTTALMSIDEEWRGWGDLLDPYVVGFYLAVTLICIGAAVLLCRNQLGRRHPNSGSPL